MSMRTIKTRAGTEVPLDGDLLAVLEALYRTLNERAASEALKVENKRDQKQMDDHAARGARYKQR